MDSKITHYCIVTSHTVECNLLIRSLDGPIHRADFRVALLELVRARMLAVTHLSGDAVVARYFNDTPGEQKRDVLIYIHP